jgi:hypothetical protein
VFESPRGHVQAQKVVDIQASPANGQRAGVKSAFDYYIEQV